MTRDEFVARFPKASESTIRRNVDAKNSLPAAKPQSDLQTLTVRTPSPQTRHPAKCLVRVESRRIRLQDPDNGICKWHIDALRYAGILSDDTTAEIELALSQTKVETKAEECTVITLERLPSVQELAAAYAEKHAEVMREQ